MRDDNYTSTAPYKPPVVSNIETAYTNVIAQNMEVLDQGDTFGNDNNLVPSFRDAVIKLYNAIYPEGGSPENIQTSYNNIVKQTDNSYDPVLSLCLLLIRELLKKDPNLYVPGVFKSKLTVGGRRRSRRGSKRRGSKRRSRKSKRKGRKSRRSR